MKSKKILAFAALLLLFYVFLIVTQKEGRGIFGFQKEVDRVIELKLSPDDLIVLNRRETTLWTSVRWLETHNKSLRVKIRPHPGSGLDFQLDIYNTVYNLFELSKSRKAAYNFFQEADSWKLQRSSPHKIQLKINAVPVGIYLMEEVIYEQLRDDKGEYFIHLDTDTHRMRKIRYEVETGYTGTLQHYFKKKELAAYFVFFSLFSPDSPPRLDHLWFRYDSITKKYHPYLTIGSVFEGLDEKGNIFEKPARAKKDFYKKLNKKNAANLLKKSHRSPYVSLVKAVLSEGDSGSD